MKLLWGREEKGLGFEMGSERNGFLCFAMRREGERYCDLLGSGAHCAMSFHFSHLPVIFDLKSEKDRSFYEAKNFR